MVEEIGQTKGISAWVLLPQIWKSAALVLAQGAGEKGRCGYCVGGD